MEPLSPPPITWPNGGTLTNEWVPFMSSLEWSSWNFPPSHLPSVMPVNVFDSLILTASKIFHSERNCVHLDDLNSESTVIVVGDIHGFMCLTVTTLIVVLGVSRPSSSSSPGSLVRKSEDLNA
ncbi:hypothetical protein YC2023_040467 [Brassica napus]|uniref:Uncharacterized protein n=1 Tax=Brassica oleracea TaxID=3712 RepID=A0A3P6ARP2_BRAOL|nr:unnamed protein product [Brassica oleracea]